MSEHCCHPPTVWYKEKVTIVGILFALVVLISFLLPSLAGLHASLMDYINRLWLVMLIGFALGGVIDHYIPEEYVSKVLAQKKKKTVFSAIGLGFLMSACCHGILAIAIQLYKKGSSVSSVVAFLLAAPWANLPMTFIFFGFFGMNALYIILGSLVIAFTTGLIFQALESAGIVEQNKAVAVGKDFSITADIKKRWNKYSFSMDKLNRDIEGVLHGAWELTRMTGWWILIGILVSAIAAAYVPSHFFHNYMGANIIGLLVTLFFATVLEVCSEGTSPLAFEIYRQTGAFGNAFVFLMAGVATDYTEIGLLWTNIGKKTAILLPLITVPQIVILGWLLNLLL